VRGRERKWRIIEYTLHRLMGNIIPGRGGGGGVGVEGEKGWTGAFFSGQCQDQLTGRGECCRFLLVAGHKVQTVCRPMNAIKNITLFFHIVEVFE
jgi:hypothetical protein